MKILIVDDNFQSRRLAQYLLGTLGYEVYTADSGKMGVDLIKKTNYDVVILDWNMPDLNGRQTILKLEKLFKFSKKKLNVIIYTSYPLSNLLIPATLNVHINTYISKKLSPHKQYVNFRKYLTSIQKHSRELKNAA